MGSAMLAVIRRAVHPLSPPLPPTLPVAQFSGRTANGAPFETLASCQARRRARHDHRQLRDDPDTSEE